MVGLVAFGVYSSQRSSCVRMRLYLPRAGLRREHYPSLFAQVLISVRLPYMYGILQRFYG